MALLAELYLATRARNTNDADVGDASVLVVSRGPTIMWSNKLFGGDPGRRETRTCPIAVAPAGRKMDRCSND